MSMQPESTHVAKQWIAKAEEDLLTAEHTLALGEDCPAGVVCFHAQQCAEKYMKALLVYHDIEFPKTHDLVVLLNRLGKWSPRDVPLEDAHPLNRYSVEARYPGDWEPIELQEASEAVQMTRRIRAALRREMPEELLGEGC